MPTETGLKNTNEAEYVSVGQHMHEYQPPRASADGSIRGERSRAEKEFAGQDQTQRIQNWNDVETMLSYGPNAEAGNFERTSFNLSPTLAQYLQKQHPETYQQIVAAPANLEARGEPHNVLGTPYFHAIMPLLPEHDQHTLLHWGRYDTERRLGVRPEGLWVPELAINGLSLQIARRYGYEWTFGFPHQLEGKVGAPTAYNVPLGSNDTMNILRESSHDKPVWHHFYQGDMATFYKQAERQAMPDAPYPQMHVKATDGEHLKLQRGGANGWSRDLVDRLGSASNYKQKDEVRWVRPTSFMADIKARNVELPQAELAGTTAGEGTFDERMAQTHGLDRWSGEVNGETTVPWKRELQTAYRDFSKNMDYAYKEGMGALGLKQPWDMRDDYIRLLEGEVNEQEFFNAWDSGGHVSGQERQQALKLLASQYHKLAASTSCGWFFDTPSGIEPKIVTRQMRIAIEHVRSSGLVIEPEVHEAEATSGHQMADAIEAELLARLHLAADEKVRLSQVYKSLGVKSVQSLIKPPQYY